MRFHEYMFLQHDGHILSHRLSEAEFLSRRTPYWERHGHKKASAAWVTACEYQWIADVRPYYKVWPSFCETLRKFPLSIRLCDLGLVDMLVAARFAIDAEVSISDGSLNAALMCIRQGEVFISCQFRVSHEIVEGYKSLGLLHEPRDECLMVGCMSFRQDEEKTIEESYFRQGHIRTTERMLPLEKLAARVALCLSILATDPEFVEADVLSKDRLKYRETRNPKYIEKAKRRGIVGWRIGEAYETCPHYRRPHLGLRWTGVGRSMPRIVPIKGAVVHRKQMTKVPTGYMLPNGKEVEPE